MNALTSFPTELTPRAFDARVAQLARKGFTERTSYAELNGAELEWAAFFDAVEDPSGGINHRHEVCSCMRHTLAGAWTNDDDGRLYAGNRDEMIALIGQAQVERWEAEADEASE